MTTNTAATRTKRQEEAAKVASRRQQQLQQQQHKNNISTGCQRLLIKKNIKNVDKSTAAARKLFKKILIRN